MLSLEIVINGGYLNAYLALQRFNSWRRVCGNINVQRTANLKKLYLVKKFQFTFIAFRRLIRRS